MTFRIGDAEIGDDILSSYYDDYDPNKVVKIYGDDPKLECPKVLMIDNRPAYLYGPGGWNFFGGDRTVCYVLKIKIPKIDERNKNNFDTGFGCFKSCEQ